MNEEELVAHAVDRRAGFAHDVATTAYRLINGAGDRLSGVTADRYGEAVVVNLYDETAERRRGALVAALARNQGVSLAGDGPHATTGDRLEAGGPRESPRAGLSHDVPATLHGVTAIYVKRRPRSAARLSPEETAALAPSTPDWGAPLDEVIVRENGLRFLIRPGGALSAGLFLDMREIRARVRTLAHGRTVLNLFAYTCAFGVAASAGGARRVLNLDAARPALRWGVENYALNGLAADPHDFVYGDAFDWLNRLARRGESFDLIIADPPSFSSVKGRRFVASRDYAALTAACARVTAPGGLLLLCANEAALPRRAFRAACLRGVGDAGRKARVRSYDGAPTLDFPLAPGDDSHLKALLLELRDEG